MLIKIGVALQSNLAIVHLGNGMKIVKTQHHCGFAALVVALGSCFALPGATASESPTEPLTDSIVPLPTMTVTARFRPEFETKVPISLVVVGGDALLAEGRYTLGQLDSRVANLQLGDLNGTPALFMRGVGGGGRQVAFEPRTGIYVDGVFMNVPPLTDALLLDLERVEILRGPQGSLFGQNTVSGAVSLVTREPGDAFAFESVARLDNRGAQRLGMALDTPLADTLRMRVSGTLARSRGETLNLVNGDRPDAYSEAGARVRLQWRATPGFQADIAADLSHHGDDFPTGEARTSTLGNGPDANPGILSVALNTPQRDDLRNSGVSATLRWDHPLGEVTSISAWRAAERRWAADLDYSPADRSRLDYVDRYRRLSQELRLTSRVSASPFRWLGGLYAFRQNADSYRPLFADADIKMFVPPLNPGDTLIVEPDVQTDSYALFGSLGYALSATFRVDAGLRLVTSRLDLDYTQRSSAGYQSLGVLPVTDVRRSETESAFLPDVALSWDLTRQMTAYGRYARGSKSGGFDADVLTAARTVPPSFSEESVDSYEIGLKGEAFGGRLSGSLALFLAEYRDYQVSQFQPVGNNLVAPVIANAGKVRSYGPELEVQMRPLQRLTLRTSTAYLSSTYADFQDGGGPGVDFSDNRTEFAPRWSINSSLEYFWPLPQAQLSGALSYAWRSRFFTQPSNLPAFEADIRRLLSARLTLTGLDGRLDLGLFGDNLLNEQYVETINRGTLGTIYGRYGLPRSVGIQAQYRLR